jgi:hypothetical protein
MPTKPSADICLHPDFISAVTRYYNIAIGFAIILAIIIFMVAGYQLVFSAGRPNIVASGKKKLVNGIVGLSLAVLSAVFLNLINPRILSQEGVCTTAPTANTVESGSLDHEA